MDCLDNNKTPLSRGVFVFLNYAIKIKHGLIKLNGCKSVITFHKPIFTKK